MNQNQNQTQELFSDPTKVLRCTCPVCRKLLAKRTLMNDGENTTGLIYIKHRGLSLLTALIVVTCPGCYSRVRIEGTKGITEVEKNDYYDKSKRDRRFKRNRPEEPEPEAVSDAGQQDTDVRSIQAEG